ncbi:MAG: response regulator [Gammaproteobacteria bacterium]|nr:response regulator [Gammaproteobacteria bacterium]
MDSKNYYTPNEVAQLFMVSPVTVRQWAQKGLLHAALTAGGHRRFLHQELIRFAEERGLTPNWPVNGGKHVLIVEDDLHFGEFLQAFLGGRPGVDGVEIATNGFEAGRRVETLHPDIVLLDLTMPGLDGFTICHRLKGDRGTRDIRVIAMSGAPTTDNVQRILAAGAEACLPKPIDTYRLLELLHLDEPGVAAH